MGRGKNLKSFAYFLLWLLLGVDRVGQAGQTKMARKRTKLWTTLWPKHSRHSQTDTSSSVWENMFSALFVPWPAENQTFFFLPDFSSRWFLKSCHWLNFIPQPRQLQQNFGLSILLSVNKGMMVFWHKCTIKMAYYNTYNYSIIMIMIIIIIINIIQKHKTVPNSRLCFKNK